MYKQLAVILLSVLCINVSYANLKLLMPDFPPYTFKAGEHFSGIGFDKVKQIMDDTGIDYSVDIVTDYGRLVYSTKENLSDGFFLATQNKERDSFAVFTLPIMTNKWSWFTFADSPLNPNSADFINKAKIGTFINTNTHKWLQANNYQVI
jgi:hypothetical protein